MTKMKRILLVEDEPDLVKFTSFRLKKAGYDVVVAFDGKQGLEMAEKEKPDLILLDLGIPLISGLDVCRTLKTRKSLRKIPVIILTASSDRIKETAEEIGADSYIIKPYEVENLQEKLKKYLG